MVMTNNEGGDDHNEMMVSGAKSPWKTTQVMMDAPVISADSWPALADAQHRSPKPPADPPLVQVFLFIFKFFSIFTFNCVRMVIPIVVCATEDS